MTPLPVDNFFGVLSPLEPQAALPVLRTPQGLMSSNPQALQSPTLTPEVSDHRRPNNRHQRLRMTTAAISSPDNPIPVIDLTNPRSTMHLKVLSNSENGESGTYSEMDEENNSSPDSESENEKVGHMAIAEAPMVPEVLEAPSAPKMPILPGRLRSFSISSSEASFIDILIEEIAEDDVGYDSNTSVLFPCYCEDFQTDAEKAKEEAEESDESFDWSSSESDGSLVGDMGGLLLRHKEREFEEALRQKYLRKKARWIKGGNHKRNHDESLGSESDTEDIVPLDDADVIGSSARRLRRRTDTMELRPRTSLLFEDPPREIEELQFLQGEGGVIESDDELVPAWMYPAMDMDAETDSDEDEDESIPVIYLPPTRSRR